eukprot:CAMPEP_0117683834 /NCGR_PEP_ID=MMETSP0804-20121206/20675_1 /TAXON_ID=1074897 /ORGANISM="Tetraselmis astigmatica, Strain CCMP880" /LENGTH=123 /DNA_ID=CAMNT_0005494581 /DNA_START=201 /DNA_END=569 /DNA_ORIENTATION=-
MNPRDDNDLFDSLGVRGVAADTLSKHVLRQAAGKSSHGGAVGDVVEHARRVRNRLGAVEAELSVVSAALQEGEEGDGAGPPEGFEDEIRRGRELQRALAEKRLQELQEKRGRLQQELERATAA